MHCFSMLVLLALFINCVSCEKKPLSEKASILKAVRNDRDFESSYNDVTKRLFKISYPDRHVPNIDEFINSAVVEISNDIAIVTCSLAMESGAEMYTRQKDTSYIIKLKKTDNKWKIIENTTSSSGGGSMTCGPFKTNEIEQLGPLRSKGSIGVK